MEFWKIILMGVTEIIKIWVSHGADYIENVFQIFLQVLLY